MSETERELLAKGLKIKQQPVSGGMRRELSFDTSLEARYHEAGYKIEGHREKIEKYQRYGAALSEAKGRSFDLDIRDWEFFGL